MTAGNDLNLLERTEFARLANSVLFWRRVSAVFCHSKTVEALKIFVSAE